MSRAVLVAAGLLVALPLPAAARDIYEVDRGRAVRRDNRYGRGYGYAETHRIGHAKGYEEGFDEGRKDAERRRGYNVRRHDDFRDGDEGYKRDYGPKSEYVRGFRTGFEEGYRDAYRSRAGYARDDYRYGRSSYGRIYGYQRDGRHRHEGSSGWCSARHDDDRYYRRDRGRVIYEE
jgi:hypothetical protein